MLMHRGDQTLAIRALKSAAPYIRMYKGKTFVVKAGGGVFADTESTRRADRADRDPALLRRARGHGSRRRAADSRNCPTRSGVPTRMVEGRRVTEPEVHRRDVDGARTASSTRGFSASAAI